jgi:hypothetical protein
LPFGDGGEEVIVLHELEGSLDHCVLKVAGRVENRNLAGEVLTDAKMFGLPPHELTRPDEAGCHSVLARSPVRSVPSRCISMLRERSKHPKHL